MLDTALRPSEPAVARVFAAIDPTALPTGHDDVVDGRDPEAVRNRCRDITGALCKVLADDGIEACEVYLFVDHRRRAVDVSRAHEVWRRVAVAGGIWGHVVLGVPGRFGETPRQVCGPRGAVELWDWTGRQYDRTVAVPHLVDLEDWGPYVPPRHPTCRRCAHRVDDAGFARCLLPDPLLAGYFEGGPEPGRSTSLPT